MSVTATITSKGQITLPRAMRKALGSSTVEIEIDGQTVVLKPVLSVAGALSEYGGDQTPIGQVREVVWGEVADVRKP